MQKYEIMYLFSPEIPEKEIETRVRKANKNIEDLGGKISKEDHWGLKNLAYSIENFEQGYYHITWFELKPEKISKIKKKLQASAKLLRFLITKTYTKPSVAGEEKAAPQKKEPRKKLKKVSPAPLPQKKKTEKPKQETKKVKTPPESKTPKKEKADLKDLDKKLDEILKEDVA